MQCQCLQKAESFIQRHNLSTLVFLGALVGVIGVISPSIIYAEEFAASYDQTGASTVQVRYPMPSSSFARPGLRPSEMRGPSSTSPMDNPEQRLMYYSMVSTTPEQAAAQLQILKASLQNPEKVLSDLQSKISYLQKQGIKVPDTVLEQLKKAQVALGGIKNADSVTEAVNTGTPELPGLLDSLNKAQPDLSKLAAWQQQAIVTDKDLKTMKTTAAFQNKSALTKLSKNNFDASALFKDYASTTAELQAKLAAAKKLVKTDSAQALLMQKDIASRLEEAAQAQKTLKDFGNIASATGTVKRGIITAASNSLRKTISESEQVIKMLKVKNVDTAALESKLNEARAKDQQIIQLLSAKPVDKKAVSDAFRDLMQIRQDFVKIKNSLTVPAVASGSVWKVPSSTWKILNTRTVDHPTTGELPPVSPATTPSTNTVI